MTNGEIKPEMKVSVDVDGVMKPAKVIGPTTKKTGNYPTQITGWVVQIEPTGLNHTTTADKIHPRGGSLIASGEEAEIAEIETLAKKVQFTRVRPPIATSQKIVFTRGENVLVVNLNGTWNEIVDANTKGASGNDLSSLRAFLINEGRGRVTGIEQK